jgi:hypothetical protein
MVIKALQVADLPSDGQGLRETAPLCVLAAADSSMIQVSS